MKMMIVWALLLAFVMPLAASQVLAADETAQTGIVDAGNKLCPITGEPVSGSDFVTYQGKQYGLCCSMCEASFLENPGKYIAQMEVQEKASASVEMERDMEQGDL